MTGFNSRVQCSDLDKAHKHHNLAKKIWLQSIVGCRAHKVQQIDENGCVEVLSSCCGDML